MAIYQRAGINFDVYGDGTSTVQNVDLTKVIEAPFGIGGSFTNKPTGDIVVLVSPVCTVLLPNQQFTTITGTAEMVGNILIVTWASAPPAATSGTSGNSAVVTLGY
jgi:hypothetical protein